ncbi:MAG: hypothetical protein R3Y52_01790 [Psittacicella sp.]
MLISKHTSNIFKKYGLNELYSYIRINIDPIYEKYADPIHGINHVHDVLNLSFEILQDESSASAYKIIMIGSLCHDIYAGKDRKNHHLLAYEYVLNNLAPKEFLTIKEITIAAQVCLEHRASYKGEFSSIYSEIVSSADRGEPKDMLRLLKKSIIYHKYHFHTNRINTLKGAVEHIFEKNSRTGYAKYPDIYKKYYSQTLEKVWEEIDNAKKIGITRYIFQNRFKLYKLYISK